MRSDIVQVLNFTSAQLRDDHCSTLHEYLSPKERVNAIWTATLMSPTCFCMTTARLLVVDGFRGKKVRGVFRGSGIQMDLVSSFSGFSALFVSSDGVLEVKHFQEKQAPQLRSFFAAGDRELPTITPDSSMAPLAIRPLVVSGLTYVNTLMEVLIRRGQDSAFIDEVRSGGVPVIGDHAIRYFIAKEAMVALAPYYMAKSTTMVEFYAAFIEWFLIPEPPSRFSPIMQSQADYISACRADNAELLASALQGAEPADAQALGHCRAVFLTELYRLHDLPVPEADAVVAIQVVAQTINQEKSGGIVEHLRQLGEMREGGLLTEDEYVAAKTRVLQS